MKKKWKMRLKRGVKRVDYTINLCTFILAINRPMKVCVFMSDNRPLDNSIDTAEYNSLVASINYAYCKKYNYDFIYYRPYINDKNNHSLYNCIDPNTKELRHASWSKLLSTSQILDLNYDYVVYIDSDCIFKDFNLTLDKFIEPITSAPIIFLNNKPWNSDKPCAGFYICKVCDETKQFIKGWYNYKLPSNNKNHTWEQEALWRILKNINMNIIDSIMFLEKEGQYLRHVSSYEKNIRTEYFLNFIKTNNIIYDVASINVIEYDTTSLC